MKVDKCKASQADMTTELLAARRGNTVKQKRRYGNNWHNFKKECNEVPSKSWGILEVLVQGDQQVELASGCLLSMLALPKIAR